MSTLRKYRNRPMSTARDISAVPVAEWATQYVRLREALTEPLGSEVEPEHAALWFYMMNHAVAEVGGRLDPDELLGDYQPLLDEYYDLVSMEVLRAAYYLLVITTREARHVSSKNNGLLSMLAKDESGEAVEFVRSIRGISAGDVLGRLISSPPDATLGPFTVTLERLFEEGCWSSSYGGKKWASVIRPLRQMVYGVITPEALLDTVFTLCHNGGPIFNKGYFYGMYNKQYIWEILDVQRAGQIPAYVGSGQGCPFVTPDMVEWHARARELLPGGAFEADYVDWFAVEAAEAVNSYGDKKAAQEAAHGLPDGVLAEKAAASSIEILPGLHVEKIEREAVA